MGLAIDASTPARWVASVAHGTPVTSASFTPPAGSLLVLCFNDFINGTNSYTVSDSIGLTWTARAGASASNFHGWAAIYTAVATGAPMTVSITFTVGTNVISAKLYVLTGADTTTVVGGGSSGNSATNNLTTTAFTATDSGLVFACGVEWNQLGVPTSADLTLDANGAGTGVGACSGYKTIAAGGSITVNLDAAGTATARWGWVTQEILPAGGGGGSTGRVPPRGGGPELALAVWDQCGVY